MMGGQAAMLTGTWILKREGDKSNPKGKPVPPGEQDVLTLDADGRMTYLKKARSQENRGVWEFAADGQTLRIGGERPDEKESMDVLELSAKKLVMKTGPWVLTWEKGTPPRPQVPKAPADGPADPLVRELLALWSRFLDALRHYRLDEIRALVEVRPEEPIPPRAQAEAMAGMLPDLSSHPCLQVKREGRYAGVWVDTSPEGETEVTLLRFVEGDSGWRLVPAPNTLNAVGTDQKKDKLRMIAEEPSLRLVKEGMEGAASAPAPAAPAKEPAFTEDRRPDGAIRKDLEVLWTRLREACSKGDVEAASAILHPPPGPTSADELKAAAMELPDLAGGRFLRLVRSREKPWLLGYYTALPGKSATRRLVTRIVFARVGSEWRFPTGAASIERADVATAESTSLDPLLKKHAALRL
jgi:hypothetical protein